MYHVYPLYNKKHDKIYIGQTENLESRLNLHRNETFSKSYTARFDGEWILIYDEEVLNRSQAPKREGQLKDHKGRDFIRKRIPL